jgi:hypothetical protein
MGSFVAIAFTADFVISTAQRGITDDYARRFMRGTITLIEDELFRHPRRTWQKKDQGTRRKILLPPRHRRAHHARPHADRRPRSTSSMPATSPSTTTATSCTTASAPAARYWWSARWPPTAIRN